MAEKGSFVIREVWQLNTLDSHSMISPFGKQETCARFIIDTISNPFVLHDITSDGQNYVFSCWLKSEVDGKLFVAENTLTSTTTWTKHTVKFTAGSSHLSMLFTIPGTYYIYRPQLEIGDHATDWTPAPEDIDQAIIDSADEVRETMSEQYTSILETSKEIIMSALESYVLDSDYETFKTTVETQLKVMADNITMSFTTTEARVDGLDDDVQAKFTEIYKYITFSDDGITIGGNENNITLVLDNDGIIFRKNGVAFGRWDGVDFYTGNIVVEVSKRAQFGNFSFIPRSDGSLSFLMIAQSSLPTVTIADGVMTIKNTTSTFNGTAVVIEDITVTETDTTITLEV